MPDPGSRAVYMLSGHATAGVNWRPTRFAEDLPQPRICGLCCTVPKRTVLLPCSHFLCDSCNAARDKDGRRVCPLDMKAFEEDECSWIDFPAKRASNLKVHCWNESDGCEFVGTIEAVLQHYEGECAFHSLQCPRCEQRMPRSHLVVHYVAGCSRRDLSADCAQSDGCDGSLPSRGVSARVNERKPFLTDPCNDLPSTRHRQLKEHLELSKASDSAHLQNISRVISGFDNRLQQSMESMEANISSMLIRQLNAGLSELKALLGDRCSDDLTTVQSQMNQLVEESRARDAAQLQEILCALKDSENKLEADVDRVETNLSSALMQQLQVSP
ncbi:TNF receptor-associated factor 5 isoform X3 [Dermacentor silvarum]|uniref:TNF receptor-associated factor 5 isoform X3 n=1 Tax=Dermacentor silvarum TaxID=543639 RepID=UPI00189758AF|nr:TNF receptor-associated factor 5 isoform X3 [Dermacentor silvarum]